MSHNVKSFLFVMLCTGKAGKSLISTTVTFSGSYIEITIYRVACNILIFKKQEDSLQKFDVIGESSAI